MFIPSSVPYLKQMKAADINSFLMLFFDNFSSLVAILAGIIGTPRIACQFDPSFGAYYVEFESMVFKKMCPGIGMALIFGNLWYAWMAAKLAKKENRMDVTALPYGINTPAGFLTCYMVMLPLAFKYSPKFGFTGTPDDFADKVFHGACAANFLGGIFEICGLVLADPMRKWFPRAALFAPIAGVGFVWLGFAPVIDVMREPLVGIIPLALTFTGFFSSGGKGAYHVNIPVAFLIMIVGLAFWWAGMARWDTEDRELNDSRKMGEILQSAMHKYVGKLNWTP
jgi:adenine/guanine/hypoxanthine permease